MKFPKTLALVLAGGKGNRMQQLTNHRAKPALPFAGNYRLIDFPLSNCVHSQIENVWVIEQFQPHALNEHLTNGRPWDLDRTHGGLQILPPYQGAPESGWHQGNADALYRNARFIRDFDPKVLLVLSADHIYKLDYRDVIAAHLEKKAEVTMVTTQVETEEAKRFGNVRTDKENRVIEFAYKPDEPISDIATTEVFVYDTKPLLDMLDDLAARSKDKGDDDEVALEDWGDELLPELVNRGRTFAFPLDGYWRDVGTIDSYYQGHMDFLSSAPLNLDDPDWPILTRGSTRQPARINGQIENSLISSGCTVLGRVSNSILSPGVVIEAGAAVEDSIILHDAIIQANVSVRRAVVDEKMTVSQDVAGEAEIAVVGRD